ncbi:hypothetical protein TNIN_457651 [Trichonephila inaurata madagascariensis]|uniref:Uncharacterized protein n=1 Tax=Trichonephila inaurata madagascariensis TaxID=2747483 RepID=A0A8X6Y7T5_9ARAC|nr:hypothetical protein TNIN_457651 [Trichonephila inaurata madagascariensis]
MNEGRKQVCGKADSVEIWWPDGPLIELDSYVMFRRIRYVTRAALQRSLRSNAVPSSIEEVNLSSSDEDYFNSFEGPDRTNTRVRTEVIPYIHKVKWIVKGYSLTPTNKIINGPAIDQILSPSSVIEMRIAFEKKENGLQLIVKSLSKSYSDFQTKIVLRDYRGSKLYEEGFGPNYFIREDENVDLIVSNRIQEWKRSPNSNLKSLP